MRRRSHCHPYFRRFHDSRPERREEGRRGFEFCTCANKPAMGPAPSWSILASRRTELTRVNKRLCPQGTGWSKT